jgi:hypothetical protein
MGKMDKVALGSSQVATRNWNQAFRLLNECPEDTLDYITRDESHYIVSPSVTEPIRDGEGYESDMPLAIAARVPKGRKRPAENDALFLVMDDNVLEPAFAIQKYTNVPLTAIAKADGEGIDAKDIDLILNKIEDNIRGTVQTRRADKQRARRHRRAAFAKTSLVTLLIVVIAGGSTYGLRWKHNHDQAEAAKQQAATEAANKAEWDRIAAYDVKGVMLQSPLLGPGSAAPARIDRFALSLLDETPPLQDLLNNPRKAVVRAGETKQLTKVPLGKGVRVVTDAPEGHVVVDVTDDGTVWLLALPADASPLYNIVVQSQPLSK